MSFQLIESTDRNILLGDNYASTGETKEQYEKRMKNRMSVRHTVDSKKIEDSHFLKTLPYTLYLDILKDVDGIEFTSITVYDLFQKNLEKSIENELRNEAFKQLIDANSNLEFNTHMAEAELGSTAIGANDAINPYWSFNENDDIIYPNHALDPVTCKHGLGRVYFEVYHKHQVVLWMSFGVPKYVGILDFYRDAIDPKLASVMHAGTESTAAMLGRIVGGAMVFAFNMATLPLYVLNQIGKLFDTYQITKYYEFNAVMLQYYKAVNNMLGITASNMGLQNPGENNAEPNRDDLPDILRDGLDIYSIVTRRSRLVTASKEANKEKVHTTDEIYSKGAMSQPTIENGQMQGKESGNGLLSGIYGWFRGLSDAFISAASGSGAYMGFRVEKSVDASESFSNSTGQSELQSALNDKIRQINAAKFATAHGTFGSGGFTGALSAITGAVGDFVKGAISAIDVTGLSGMLTGTGFFDIPEVYQSSSFSTSYSFSTQLVSHYCDRVSIFQNCYVPLFCLMAAALPRQTGKNTYVSPFLVRAYCKGRFAVTLGIIDSMSIKRGGDEYGWNEESFPTRIDVSWSIKDLSPLMFMGCMGSGTSDNPIKDLMGIFNSNTNMQEYLSTLSGLGLKERVLFMPTLKRRFAAWWNVHFENKLKNPYWWGVTLGGRPAMQAAFAIAWSRLSNN